MEKGRFIHPGVVEFLQKEPVYGSGGIIFRIFFVN